MEIKQLEYFVKIMECGSISKASQELFTTQPNVSKVINLLEQELKIKLFTRNNKGVKPTDKGLEIYDYAKTMLKNKEMILSINEKEVRNKLKISCYSSNLISKVICDFYKKYENVEVIFLEGVFEEIIKNVILNKSEIGLIYINNNRIARLNHILKHKNLEFVQIKKLDYCVYVGKKNKFYSREEISTDELLSLDFIQPIKDILSIEEHLENIKLKNYDKRFRNVMTTNSDNLVVEALKTTDVANFGVSLNSKNYKKYGIRCLKINGYSHYVYFGYIKPKDTEINKNISDFINLLQKKI